MRSKSSTRPARMKSRAALTPPPMRTSRPLAASVASASTRVAFKSAAAQERFKYHNHGQKRTSYKRPLEISNWTPSIEKVISNYRTESGD